MGKIRVPKLLAIAVLCLLLAGALSVQALSSVSFRSAPEQSVTLFPANGMAMEQYAVRTFQGAAEAEMSTQEAAELASSIARDGISWDPLAPKSYAILAIAEQDAERKAAILEGASTINRRDIFLQELVLLMHGQNDDTPAVVNTLDQILRVHPNVYTRYFPELLKALKDPRGTELFADILDGSSPWHESFLLFAVRDEGARVRLETIRDRIVIDNPDFDKRLILGLAEQGETEKAYRLYIGQNGQRSLDSEAGGIAWNSDFPPFDWALAQERDFRSQPSRDGARLELFVRSGQGGVIAQRIIAAPSAPAAFNTEMTMRASGRSDGIRMAARCAQSGKVVFDQPLSEGANAIILEALPRDCARLVLEINARALRGEPTLRAELSPIAITAS